MKRIYVNEQRCLGCHLKGYILAGDIARAGIYTSLIREQTRLSKIDFELIKDKPQLMAFSKKERAEMLGGAVS